MAMLDAIANPPRQLERFAVRSGENTLFVPINEVDWIEAFQNYVRLHAGPATYLLHVPMNTIEGVLDSNRFLRIHRSYQIRGLFHGHVSQERIELALQQLSTLGIIDWHREPERGRGRPSTIWAPAGGAKAAGRGA